MGAPDEGIGIIEGAGAAYFFDLDALGGNNTSEYADARLLASDPHLNDHVGAAVAVEGDVILVGAPYDNDGASSDSWRHEVCDQQDPEIKPEAEMSDLEGDCSQCDTNNWISCYDCLDIDGDHYWAGCDRYFTILGPDCGNYNGQINPGMPEICNEWDDDCDGLVDEGCNEPPVAACSNVTATVTVTSEDPICIPELGAALLAGAALASLAWLQRRRRGRFGG